MKKKKGTKVLVIILCIILAAIIGFMAYIFVSWYTNRENKDTSVSSGSEALEIRYVGSGSGSDAAAEPSGSSNVSVETTPAVHKEVPAVSGDNLKSQYALMTRVSDDAVVFDKDSTAKIYPASMTKIMTALIGLENISDYDQQVTITQSEIDAGYVHGATMAGFQAGETVTVRDLLYGIMLPSGADACNALCDLVSGSETEFVKKMNEKAKEIGMDNTNFVTSTGLHDDNHYSTCADFAKLVKYAIQNEDFRKLFGTETYTTSATSVHPDGITLRSTCFKHLDSATLSNGAVIEGAKTGFTNKALFTMSSLAKAGSEEYILVTAYGQGSAHPNVEDAVTMYSQLPSE